MRSCVIERVWKLSWQPFRQYSSSHEDRFGPLVSFPLQRVVVTGLGLVTPLGIGVTSSWTNLCNGACGIRKINSSDLSQDFNKYLSEFPSRIAAFVPRDEVFTALSSLQAFDLRRNSPFVSYGVLAAEEALRDADWFPNSSEERQATGVAMGAGMGCSSEVADAALLLAEGKLKRLSPFFVPRVLVNMLAGAVSIRHGFQGPNHAVSTACATGVHAIGDAFRMIQRGDASVMVAGASESCVDAISLGGFSRLKALSTAYNETPEKASRPFDAGRDGFLLGEGAGAMILEELDHARARGAKIYAEVRGYGMSGDGHHITHPHPEGLGAQLVMKRAFKHSGIQISDVAYINAHATSTPKGDEIEQHAIHSVFGPEIVESIAVSSTKGATGHLLGAAGAVESVFTVLSLVNRVAPPTLNLENPDPPLLPGLVGPASRGLREGPIAALCNSFGFGGTNGSILFASPPV